MKRCIFLFSFLIWIACNNAGAPVGPLPPDIPVNELLAVPETLSVQDRQIILTTSMWRDFMPVAPPDGEPLAGVCFVSALDSTSLASSLTMDALWIVHKNEVWKTCFLEDYNPPDPDRIRIGRIFRDGPKWGPDVLVDVIVRIDVGDGNLQLLRAASQLIGATY